MDYPQYVGFTILELAKSKLYNFYYQALKAHYGDKVNIYYSDTDGYIHCMNFDDIYKKEWIDTSLARTIHYTANPICLVFNYLIAISSHYTATR